MEEIIHEFIKNNPQFNKDEVKSFISERIEMLESNLNIINDNNLYKNNICGHISDCTEEQKQKRVQIHKDILLYGYYTGDVKKHFYGYDSEHSNKICIL